MAKKQAEALKTEGIGKFWDDIMTEYGGLLPESQKEASSTLLTEKNVLAGGMAEGFIFILVS